MQTWRQIDEDGTQSVISSDGCFWRAKLLHTDGNSTPIGLIYAGLQEAKLMCEMAWKHENAHDWNPNFKDWNCFDD